MYQTTAPTDCRCKQLRSRLNNVKMNEATLRDELATLKEECLANTLESGCDGDDNGADQVS